ncbi:MAG: alpha/beta fold hydrolase, partial [Terrimicrobiaceae bacterium]|nr:alpha/beta fold hydrolase [Terrimicrobiaceae bacterium]
AFARLMEIERLPEEAPACDVAIGYSMGGRRALAHAARGAVRKALVLVSSNPGIENPALRLEQRRADLALASKIRAWQGGSREFFEWWWSQSVFAAGRWDARFREALLRRRLDADFRAAASELETWGQGARNFWPLLESLELPVLAVAGALDPKYAAIAAGAARRARRGQWRLVADAAHLVPLEQPGALAQAVGDFLEEIFGRAA